MHTCAKLDDLFLWMKKNKIIDLGNTIGIILKTTYSFCGQQNVTLGNRETGSLVVLHCI